MNREVNMIKTILITTAITSAMLFGISNIAKAENKIWTEKHSLSYSGKTKAGTGEQGYSKDYEHKIEGKYSEKFVLGHGDCGWEPNYNDCESDRGRTERKGKYSKSRNVWYKFSFFVDPSWDKATTASIAQVKVSGVRPPVWMLRIDHGQLLWDNNALGCRVKNLMSLDKLAGKWIDVVIYTNYSKKSRDWADGHYSALWINDVRQDISTCSSQPQMGKYASAFHKKGASFRYGLYHSYVSRELYVKALVEGVEMKLAGWEDKGSKGSKTKSNSKSKTNTPWEVDWPVKLETKRIWFDNMHLKASKKNIWNMNMEWSPKDVCSSDNFYKPASCYAK